jgi:hypothetical protein
MKNPKMKKSKMKKSKMKKSKMKKSKMKKSKVGGKSSPPPALVKTQGNHPPHPRCVSIRSGGMIIK